MPGTGDRPTALNARAARGRRTMNDASNMTWETIAVNATAKVTQRRGRRTIVGRSRASRTPLRSATATPRMTLTTTGRGAKPAKFSIAESTAITAPLVEKRLLTVTVSSVPGRVTPDPGTGEDRTDRTEDEGEDPEQPERVRQQIAHSLDRLEAAEDQSHARLIGPGGGSGIRRRGGDCLA